MYTWNLRDAALDFYDRNCRRLQETKGGRHSKPPEPRLQERDQQRTVEAQKASAAQAREAEAHDARRLARSLLREGLSPLSSALVDHIDEFDEQPDQHHRDILCESARLAPEHFVAPLVTYIFDLTEKEPWFTEAGLTILDHVKAEPPASRASLSHLWERFGPSTPMPTYY